jgi:molybdopterin converting factor subunit 1
VSRQIFSQFFSLSQITKLLKHLCSFVVPPLHPLKTADSPLTYCMERVTIKVLFFAASKDLAGVNQSTLSLPSRISFDELKNKLCETFNLQILANNIVLAVNQNYFESGEIELKDGDELAVIPPLSAG